MGEESYDLCGSNPPISFNRTQSFQGRTRAVIQIENQGTSRNLSSSFRSLLRSDGLNRHTQQLSGLLDLGQEKQVVDDCQNDVCQSLPTFMQGSYAGPYVSSYMSDKLLRL